MSQFDSDTTPSVNADFSVAGEPPAWPKVVGIISIVWASLGIVCNLCGVAGSAFQGAFLNMMPPEQQEQMRAQMAAGQSPLVLGTYVLGSVLAVELLVAGIATVRRRPIGRLLHLAYGAAGVLLVLLSTFATWSAMQAQLATMQQGASEVAKQQAAAMQGGMMFGMAFGVCIGLAYPAFCLVWFGVMGKRPEAGAMPQDPLV